MLVFCPITKPSINTVMILNCIHARWKLSMKHSKDRRTAISKKADSRLLASHIWVQLHYIILYSFGTGYALQQRIKMRKPRTQSLETVQIGYVQLEAHGLHAAWHSSVWPTTSWQPICSAKQPSPASDT